MNDAVGGRTSACQFASGSGHLRGAILERLAWQVCMESVLKPATGPPLRERMCTLSLSCRSVRELVAQRCGPAK